MSITFPRAFAPAKCLNRLGAACRRPAISCAVARQVRWSSATTEPMQSTNHPQYTSESYPELRRDSRFTTLTAEHVRHFREVLKDPSAVIGGNDLDGGGDAAELDAFNCDWMRKYRGQSRLVLRPKSTAEVQRILYFCNARRLAVVPQGGNSGLVGGSVPVFDEIVVSLARMDRIYSFDAVSGALVADAGCVLERVDGFLAERGHLFPLDLGAKGSCQLGGNVATNAGGLRLLRYGSLHGNVLGLEAVLPDGTLFDDLGTLRKNNTGFDVKQLFIGGEGSIGIITKVAVLCPPRPRAVNVALLGLDSFAQVQRAYAEAKGQLAEILSAFELMDGASQDIVQHVTQKKRPLEGRHPFYCLVETSGSRKEHDDEKLEKFLEHVMEQEIVADGVLAQDETQAQALWAWRERIPECLGHWGGVYKYDVSIPLPELYGLVDDTRQRLAAAGLMSAENSNDANDKGIDLAGGGGGSGATTHVANQQHPHPVVAVVGYGHMGDANLHLNVATRRFDRRVERQLEPFVYEWIRRRRGSISAEHGIGLAKKYHLPYSRSGPMIKVMKGIKNMFDPNGIMNPYKFV